MTTENANFVSYEFTELNLLQWALCSMVNYFEIEMTREWSVFLLQMAYFPLLEVISWWSNNFSSICDKVNVC